MSSAGRDDASWSCISPRWAHWFAPSLDTIHAIHLLVAAEERTFVEALYRHSSLQIIVATSTLAAGVNLPAQRVVIAGARIAGHPLDVGRYRQMAGRAGRAGHVAAGARGTSFLLGLKRDERLVQELLGGELAPLESQLENIDGAMERAMLDCIVAGM